MSVPENPNAPMTGIKRSSTYEQRRDGRADPESAGETEDLGRRDYCMLVANWEWKRQSSIVECGM